MHDLFATVGELVPGYEMHHQAVDKLDAILVDQPIFAKLAVTISRSWPLPFVASAFSNYYARL